MTVTIRKESSAITLFLGSITQVPSPHAPSHEIGGTDLITVEKLTVDAAVTAGFILIADGAGAAAWATHSAGAHAVNHQTGGSDEINVGGLFGLLADAQTPLTHAAAHADGGGDELSLENLAASGTLNQLLIANGTGGAAWAAFPLHAAAHQNGGGDEINVGALSGLLADAQTPLAHAAAHADGGTDELIVENLAAGGTSGQLLISDGLGAAAWAALPLHASAHSDGAADEIIVNNLAAGGTSGQVLTSDGLGAASFQDAGGAPGGATTQIQFNLAGVFAGSSDFTWDDTGKVHQVGGTIQAATAAGPAFLNTTPFSTIPTLIPRRTDLTTGISSPANGALSFVTDGGEAIRIDASQFVAIGGSIPLAKLTVSPTIRTNTIELAVGPFSVGNDLSMTKSASGGFKVTVPALTSGAAKGAEFTIGSMTATSGSPEGGNFKSSFQPTSGTATYAGLRISPSINQTGGASGISRGLHIVTVLAAAADYRAFEVDVGRSVFGGGVVVGTDEGLITIATGDTVRAPDVIAGGAGNIAGADLTIGGGLGTGTGDTGDVLVSVPVEAAAGDNLQSRSTIAQFASIGTALAMGFFGAAPVAQVSNIGALTDSSGGSTDGTVAAVSGSGADADINNNFAELVAKVNSLEQLVEDYGFTA